MAAAKKIQRLDPDGWGTKKRWAERFEVSTKTIERWIEDGLHSEKLNGKVRIHEDWMNEYRMQKGLSRS